MGLQCGIVGLPNVGKSTLFNALTKASVSAANYPFCTIDPNVGIVNMSDARLATLANIVHTQRIIPATVEFVDIAGLVAGASKGEGLGNQFLANIRHTQAIIHVVRCFADPNIIHVAQQIDPISDIQTIHLELMLADLATVEKTLLQRKNHRSPDKTTEELCGALEKAKQALNAYQWLRHVNLSDKEQQLLGPLGLLTLKPLLYVANVAENGFVDNPILTRLQRQAKEDNIPIIAVCATMEAEIANLSDEDKIVFLSAMDLKELGLNRLIRAAYVLLNLQTYFTAGPKEVRAWTIPTGYTASQAAGVIHTDFEKGFIRAQTIAFEDFVAYGGEQGAKEHGKMRIEGKNYLPKDGDVMHFLFNV